MNGYELGKLNDCPERIREMAAWCHEKWGISYEAYLESMEESLVTERAYPAWYMAVSGGRIVGGLGVIENDFHELKHLKPNVVAVYVEPDHRGRGIAGALLRFVCADMSARGIKKLYLVTDHTDFYERYGWRYLCPVHGEGEAEPSRYYVYPGDEET